MLNESYNSASFAPEEVKKGLHLDLLQYLLSYNEKSEKNYNDIHITTDGYCVIIEWDQIPYDHSYGGTFQYVDSTECRVMRDVAMPDGTYELIDANEDPDIYINDWLKDNPGWAKDSYGHWYNEEDQRLFEESLKKND